MTDDFFRIRMGQDFYDTIMPKFAAQLARLNARLAKEVVELRGAAGEGRRRRGVAGEGAEQECGGLTGVRRMRPEATRSPASSFASS